MFPAVQGSHWFLYDVKDQQLTQHQECIHYTERFLKGHVSKRLTTSARDEKYSELIPH